MKKGNKRNYDLIYEEEVQFIPNYFINEEQHFDYCQNSNDPTFELYPFEMEIMVTSSDRVSYLETVLNIVRQGRKLSILTWKDFENFIADWLLYKRWSSLSRITIPQNGGVSITTSKKIETVGYLKFLWIIKKYSLNRPIGIRTIRELDYLIYKNGASKGIIVTTSRLTKGALKFIEEHKYRMSYLDYSMLERELEDLINVDTNNSIELVDKLPF